jgi:aryl-alcohol dehydrogenase-like predicted oxidoreductase
MEPFLHFALSQPVTTTVVGCDTIKQLEENVKYAANFKPMPDAAMKTLINNIRPYARELMYYKP